MRSSDGGVIEPAPIGAAKGGAAGSEIVAKRRDRREQRRASRAAAAAILALVTCASVALLQLLASSEAGAVFAQQLWMRFGKAVAYEPGYASRLVAPRNQCYDGTAQQMRSPSRLD